MAAGANLSCVDVVGDARRLSLEGEVVRWTAVDGADGDGSRLHERVSEEREAHRQAGAGPHHASGSTTPSSSREALMDEVPADEAPTLISKQLIDASETHEGIQGERLTMEMASPSSTVNMARRLLQLVKLCPLESVTANRSGSSCDTSTSTCDGMNRRPDGSDTNSGISTRFKPFNASLTETEV